MRIKKEYGILAALILALGLYLALYNPDRTHYALPDIPSVSKQKISKVEISGMKGAIILNRKDKRWEITPHGYPADADKVEGILDKIETLTLTALVSESKNYNHYDLDNEKKIAVKAWIGSALSRDFEIGKTAASYRHTFVKVAGDEGVYHARGNLRGKFDTSSDDLRDMTVLSFDKNEIHEIRITKDKQAITFSREQVEADPGSGHETDAETPPSKKVKTVWRNAVGKAVDESKVDRLLTTLANLHCEKYLDNGDKSDFKEPTYTLNLKGAQEYTLSLFGKKGTDGENYTATSSENDYPFVLPYGQASEIMKEPDEFLKKPQES